MKPYQKQCIENLQKDKMKPKLELTIMASTACNFRCEYCYEELMPKTIDSEFSSVFIKYIEKNVEHFESIFIDWFGGEPLLARKEIILISSQVKSICRLQQVPYVGSITTNGYFLDYKTFLKLLNQNILFYQVTIDGNKEWHDKYRPLKSGEGTYDVIIKNLLQIKKYAPIYRTFRIVIRNNVSKQNYTSCQKFIRIFNQLFQDDKRFQLFQFPIKDWGGERIKKMSNELFDEREVLNKDRNDILESMVASCCLASKRNGFVIDPELKVYKCHHYIQKKYELKYKNEIGYLDKKGNMYLDEKLNIQWTMQIISELCRQCKYLPNCMIICPLQDIKPYRGCKEEKRKQLENKIQEYIRRRVENERCEFYEGSIL